MPSPPRLSPNVCLHHREPESPSCYREHARCRGNLGRRRTDSPLDNSKAEPGWSAGGDGGGVRASNFAWDERPNHALSHKGLKPPAECSPLDPSIPNPPARPLDPHPPGARMPSSNPSRRQRQDPKAERIALSRCRSGGSGRSSAYCIPTPKFLTGSSASTLVRRQVNAGPHPLHAIGRAARAGPAFRARRVGAPPAALRPAAGEARGGARTARSRLA